MLGCKYFTHGSLNFIRKSQLVNSVYYYVVRILFDAMPTRKFTYEQLSQQLKLSRSNYVLCWARPFLTNDKHLNFRSGKDLNFDKVKPSRQQ